MKVENPQCRHRCTNCSTSLRSEDRANGAGCGYMLFTAGVLALLLLAVVGLANRILVLEQAAGITAEQRSAK